MEADSELQGLQMKPTDKFSEFLSTFMILAADAGMPDSRYKLELNRRLTRRVRELAIPFLGPEKTFQEFTNYVGTVVQALHANEEEAKRRGLVSRPRGGSTSGRGGRTDQGTRLDENTRQELMTQGRCFNCKESGHISRNCPRRRRSNTNNNDLKSLEVNDGIEGELKEQS